MTLKLNRALEVVVQNFIKLSAAVHELSCYTLFALSRNGEKSENPVL